MIAPPSVVCSAGDSRPTAEIAAETFAGMLPAIQRVAAYEFRRAPRSCREELVAAVVAQSYLAYVQLVARGRASLAYPTALAGYAIRRIRCGREAGCRQNVQDVLSPLAQRRKGFSVERISNRDFHDDWEDLIDDRRATPADMAACRIDFRDWLSHLQQFKQRVAIRLAAGDSTHEAAQHFQLSSARISQLRQELRDNWNAFQGVSGAV